MTETSEKGQRAMVQRLGLFCAGVDPSLLRGDRFSEARSRYAAVGAFVFLTAVFAAVFVSFAVASIDARPAHYVAAGLLWATFILCLDRQIVMAIKKSDGRTKQIMVSLPRIVLACMIGLIISKPFEMWLFSPEINLIIQQKDQQRLQHEIGAKNQLIAQNNDRVQQQIDALARENADLARCERDMAGEITDAQHQVEATFGHVGSANVSAQMNRDRIKAVNEPQREQLNEQMRVNRAQMERYRRDIKTPEPLTAPRERQGHIGLLEKLDAISEFGSHSAAAAIALEFITLLFVVIELLPVLTKLSLDPGVYDLRLANRDKKIARQEEEKWEAFHRTSSERVQCLVAAEQKKIQCQLAALQTVTESKEFKRRIARAQTGLAKAFAMAIARRLKLAAEALVRHEEPGSAQSDAGLEDEIARAARETANERGRLEEIKSQIRGFALLTMARVRQVRKNLLK